MGWNIRSWQRVHWLDEMCFVDGRLRVWRPRNTALLQEHIVCLVDLLMDNSQNEAQLMGTVSDHGTFVLLKSHQGHTSQAFFVDSSWWPRPFMETEKHSISTGTYSVHNCIWWSWCYCLGMLFSDWSQQKQLSSDQCTLCHDLIFHPIWSRAH
jgi:hypothetical protein